MFLSGRETLAIFIWNRAINRAEGVQGSQTTLSLGTCLQSSFTPLYRLQKASHWLLYSKLRSLSYCVQRTVPGAGSGLGSDALSAFTSRLGGTKPSFLRYCRTDSQAITLPPPKTKKVSPNLYTGTDATSPPAHPRDEEQGLLGN